jgi:hypothetical protein
MSAGILPALMFARLQRAAKSSRARNPSTPNAPVSVANGVYEAITHSDFEFVILFPRA